MAIVTGSSRGIGRAIAEGLADAGARVVISSRNQDACERVAAEINEKHGDERAVAWAASLSSKESLQALVGYTVSELGRIDCLVCNAASNPFYGPLSGISDEAFRKVFENNVLANHWLTSLVAPEMKKQGAGAIILISSIGAHIGSDTIGAYHISKAADLQLARNLAVEYGPDNIRVNAISPGVTRTEFARALWEDPATEAVLKRATPLGRIGEPSEMAGAAVFLASPAASFMTGQSIVIDGGMTIRGPI
nr:SDR family oxidoreductase [Hyphomonas oceanitis]